MYYPCYNDRKIEGNKFIWMIWPVKKALEKIELKMLYKY